MSKYPLQTFSILPLCHEIHSLNVIRIVPRKVVKSKWKFKHFRAFFSSEYFSGEDGMVFYIALENFPHFSIA
jgi:hypothetical protein